MACRARSSVKHGEQISRHKGLIIMEEETKGEIRERRKRNQRKMGMSGKGNKVLWHIIQEKAEKARKQEAEKKRDGKSRPDE